MRIKLDENLQQLFANILHDNGHDATTVHSQGLSGSRDEAVFSVCCGEGRTLITLE